MAKGRAA